MSPDVRAQKFLREAQKAFGKHNWREPITRRARTARIGVSQPKQTRAKDVRLLFVLGYPLARQRRMSEQGVFWEAPYPLRGLLVHFVQLL